MSSTEWLVDLTDGWTGRMDGWLIGLALRKQFILIQPKIPSTKNRTSNIQHSKGYRIEVFAISERTRGGCRLWLG